MRALVCRCDGESAICPGSHGIIQAKRVGRTIFQLLRADRRIDAERRDVDAQAMTVSRQECRRQAALVAAADDDERDIQDFLDAALEDLGPDRE